MFVAKKSFGVFRLLRNINCSFARKDKKVEKNEDIRKPVSSSIETHEIKIDQRQVNKSAALYDHYLKSRDRPMLTLDNYQIKFAYLLERAPIYVPYDKRRFEYYRAKYQFLKKTGYYPQTPKQLQVESGDYLFTQYERINPENQITHQNIVSKTEVYQYAEHSRYWKYVDPTIEDPHSIQAYSSDNVFLIVKNKEGNWEFPSRLLSEKDNHKQIFTVMNNQIFEGGPNPIVHLPQKYPIYARRVEKPEMTRGKGYIQYFFRALSINGVTKYPTQNFQNYSWVPKAHLQKYFKQDYFNETIKLVSHHF